MHQAKPHFKTKDCCNNGCNWCRFNQDWMFLLIKYLFKNRKECLITCWGPVVRIVLFGCESCYQFDLIEEICSRNWLPVIVGGTNYYIQALVSQFLADDFSEDFKVNCLSDLPGDSTHPGFELETTNEDLDYTYSRL